MKNTLDFALAMLVVSALGVITLASCGPTHPERDDVRDVPTSMPLNQFVIGRWASKAAYDPDGKVSAYTYELDVVDANTLKYIELSLNGDFLDGTTSHYTFTDASTIFVDNKRIDGGEYWFLQREGQDLIVHRTIGGEAGRMTFTIVLRRTAN